MQKIVSQPGTGPRATSCRNTGRHHLGMPGRLRRNPQSEVNFQSAISAELQHLVRKERAIWERHLLGKVNAQIVLSYSRGAKGLTCGSEGLISSYLAESMKGDDHAP